MTTDGRPAEDPEIVLGPDNAENIRLIMSSYKNALICGVKGVGKITNTITALLDKTNVSYVGNPVDYEGKRRPGSYEKYLRYIRSLKQDIRIVDDPAKLLRAKEPVIVIIDEIYGRSEIQLEQIVKLTEADHVRTVQIVGCIKYVGDLIKKMDVIMELHLDGAFIIDKELAAAICRIFGQRERPEKRTPQ